MPGSVLLATHNFNDFVENKMPTKKSNHPNFGKMTVFPARKIITMIASMPTATAVAVASGKIVAVGSLESLRPWLDRYPFEVDDRFADKVLMPGLIDAHIHPSLPAVATQFPFLAPDDWTLPTGNFPGAKTPDAYVARLKDLYAQHTDWDTIPFICWGFHPTLARRSIPAAAQRPVSR